jgi:hypothetical protein
VLGQTGVDGSLQVDVERKTPRRMRWRVILEEKFSTAVRQEAEVGVKWKVQRGWRDSQASTLGCCEYRMDQLAGWDLALDGVE